MLNDCMRAVEIFRDFNSPSQKKKIKEMPCLLWTDTLIQMES